MKLATSQFQLVVARSADKVASDALAGIELASVWIDGDHSYEGVRNDWLIYSPRVCHGGFVLFDNYSDGSFPDIDRFIEEELLRDLDGWENVIHPVQSVTEEAVIRQSDGRMRVALLHTGLLEEHRGV